MEEEEEEEEMDNDDNEMGKRWGKDGKKEGKWMNDVSKQLITRAMDIRLSWTNINNLDKFSLQQITYH